MARGSRPGKRKCGSVVAWEAMIARYAHLKAGDAGFTLDSRDFVAILKACGSLAAEEQGRGGEAKLRKAHYLQQGRAIHAEIAGRGLESDMFVASTLVDMYARCGSVQDARLVFERMRRRNMVTWNSMIMGYAQMEMGKPALDLYLRMQHEGFTPDGFTFVAALKACSSLAAREGRREAGGTLLKARSLERGRRVHADLARRGFESNAFVANTLVDMYAKCGSMQDARRVFEEMGRRDAVTWNVIVTGYAQMEMGTAALESYARMRQEGFEPNPHTFVAVLNACSDLAARASKGADCEHVKAGYLEQGRTIHADLAKRRLGSNIYVSNTLVDMYVKCGSIKDAWRVFENMMHRDVVSWTTMIAGYTHVGMGDSALGLYACMQHEGVMPDVHAFVAALKACASLAVQQGGRGIDDKLLETSYLDQGRAIHSELARRGFESDTYIGNTLIDMYSKCGSVEDARLVFDMMMKRDVVSWTAMILGYAQKEMGDSAMKLYICMKHEGITPDAQAFVAALKACGSLAASLETGKQIHSEIQRAGLEGQPYIANCLIDMYGKCGSMVDAQALFDSLIMKDSVTWNTLIAGYSGQGDCEHAFASYNKMQQEGLKPDVITFISVLTVCSHNGLVDRGQAYFKDMCLEYGISPSMNHYRCIADILGRSGWLDEALAMVRKMPFKPDTLTWMTILGACRKWNNVEIGRNGFQCVMMLDENFPAAYMLMVNIYDC